MKGRRKYTDEQIVAILQEHQGGVTATEVIRRHGIALDTFYHCKRGSPRRCRPGRTSAGACVQVHPISRT